MKFRTFCGIVNKLLQIRKNKRYSAFQAVQDEKLIRKSDYKSRKTVGSNKCVEYSSSKKVMKKTRKKLLGERSLNKKI